MGLRLASHAAGILAVLTLCVVAQVTLLGALKHDRDQDRSHDEFRRQLANAVAPVSALGKDRKPLPSGTPVAIVDIPRLGVREVVGEGTSARALMSGPGHQRDTVLPGQPGVSVLMGRRAAYGGPFASLGELRRGDRITITTGQGKHEYQVHGVRRAGDVVPPPPEPGQGRLLLDTADGPWFLPTDVLRVDAVQTSKVQPTNGVLPPFVVPESERVMTGEADALVPLAAWALVLLVAAFGVVYVHQRTGRWHAWVIGVPVLGVLGITVADQAAAFLPNLM